MRLFKKKYSEKSYGITHKGKIRNNNEDYIYYSYKNRYFILADGMGGHNAGEVASKETVLFIKNQLSSFSAAEIIENGSRLIPELFIKAHEHLIELARNNSEYRGMGCTLCLVYMHDNKMHACHVGDSRVYVINHNVIEQIGTDHSVVAQAVRNGHMTAEQAKDSNIRNKLTMAIGAPVEVIPEYSSTELTGNETILICSDGLWDMVPDADIHRIIISKTDAKEIAEDLMKAAMEAGGSDNISIIIIKL
ncbi:MAG: serine/threonine-protein phosphatase [Bacteroidales bacterium]|nr:serine/threonine-protein phosphatase [Bacteroidales bacterium]